MILHQAAMSDHLHEDGHPKSPLGVLPFRVRLLKKSSYIDMGLSWEEVCQVGDLNRFLATWMSWNISKRVVFLMGRPDRTGSNPWIWSILNSGSLERVIWKSPEITIKISCCRYGFTAFLKGSFEIPKTYTHLHGQDTRRWWFQPI